MKKLSIFIIALSLATTVCAVVIYDGQTYSYADLV
jgi:hypothetical protein